MVPRAFSVEELAERWGVEATDVEAEIVAGRLRAFVVNGKRRITADAAARFEEGGAPPEQPPASAPVEPAIQLAPAAPFSHRWPDRLEERYDRAFAGRLDGPSGLLYVRLGFGMRTTVGRERRRAVVFLSDRPFRERERAIGGRPVVEFTAVDDFEQSRRFASLIRSPAGKEIRAGQDLPADYHDRTVVPYNTVITGPYSHSGLALVAREDEHELMVHHALVRARTAGLFQ